MYIYIYGIYWFRALYFDRYITHLHNCHLNGMVALITHTLQLIYTHFIDLVGKGGGSCFLRPLLYCIWKRNFLAFNQTLMCFLPRAQMRTTESLSTGKREDPYRNSGLLLFRRGRRHSGGFRIGGRAKAVLRFDTKVDQRIKRREGGVREGEIQFFTTKHIYFTPPLLLYPTRNVFCSPSRAPKKLSSCSPALEVSFQACPSWHSTVYCVLCTATILPSENPRIVKYLKRSQYPTSDKWLCTVY
jgi:hypothetical protein